MINRIHHTRPQHWTGGHILHRCLLIPNGYYPWQYHLRWAFHTLQHVSSTIVRCAKNTNRSTKQINLNPYEKHFDAFQPSNTNGDGERQRVRFDTLVLMSPFWFLLPNAYSLDLNLSITACGRPLKYCVSKFVKHVHWPEGIVNTVI